MISAKINLVTTRAVYQTYRSLIILFTFCVILASCNSHRPLTRGDKKIFFENFKFEPSKDVGDFNYYPDDEGIDSSYWISFVCNESTLNRIRETLELKEEQQPNDGLIGGLNLEPSPWWDTTFIKKSKPYSNQKENVYWYLWYDVKKKKVYFLTFDT